MKSKHILFAVVFAAYCCHSPQNSGPVSVNQDGVYTVSLEGLKPVRKIIPLSMLVDDCILVPLESSEEAYVKPMITTITEKYIGIAQGHKDADGTFKLFGRSGKFLCTLDSIDANTLIYDVIIDDKNELIYLAHWFGDNISVYDTSGQFVKDIDAPQILCQPVMFLSDDILTIVHTPVDHPSPIYSGHNVAEAMVFQFDVNTGELLKKLAPPAHLIVEYPGDGFIYTVRNTPGKIYAHLYYHARKGGDYRDSLFHFDMQKDKILPVFTMTYNITDLPIDPMYSLSRKPHFYHLNKDLIMTELGEKGLVATYLSSQTSSWVRILNDYFGNLPVPIYRPNFSNGYFVHNMKPEDLIKEIKTRLSEKSCTEDDRKKLNEMLSTLKEGDNNVVFIGKLKSEIKLW